VRAGISYALAEAMDEGHCGLPVDELTALTQKLLDVPADLVETALGLELEQGTVIADEVEAQRCIFLASLYHAEREIAERLGALASGSLPWHGSTRRRPFHGSRPARRSRLLPANRKRSTPHWHQRCWSSPVAPVSAKPRWSTRC